MSSLRARLFCLAPLALASVLAAPTAHAATNLLANLTCTSGSAAGNWVNACSNSAVSVTAWAANGVSAGSTFAQTNVRDYNTGDPLKPHLGVGSAAEIANVGNDPTKISAPDHAMDNNGQYEFLLINFLNSSFSMSSVQLGWSQTDSDLTIMKYTGGGDAVAALNGKSSTQIAAAGSGWSLVSNVFNAGTAEKSVTGGESSSWWLISAYNSTLAAKNGAVSNDTTADYVKLMAVSGTVVPRVGTPEPASLALAGVALAAMVGVNRRRKKAAAAN